jgi:hypothetical protein
MMHVGLERQGNWPDCTRDFAKNRRPMGKKGVCGVERAERCVTSVDLV